MEQIETRNKHVSPGRRIPRGTNPAEGDGEPRADGRLRREKAFYDRCNQGVQEYGAGRFYSIARQSNAFFREQLGGDLTGRRVLECGCGPGSYAFFLAHRGAEVTGIDISGEAIARAREKALRQGAAGASFAAMNAEALQFADRTFDLICGNAILHHLDLRRALPELTRCLKPDGRAVFIEPLGHNPLINLYRRLTPQYRTPDEHPLRMADFDLARRHFGSVETHFFHFFTLAAVPFRRRRGFAGLVRVLGGLDQAMFSALPFTKPWGWTCVIKMTEPKA